MNRIISSLLWKFKNRHILKLYKELKEHESSLNTLSERKLKLLLSHAKSHVPYYRDIDLDRVEVNDLTSLPIMTKDILRNNFKELTSSSTLYPFWENTSGGSTGEPVKFLQDRNYQDWVDVTLYYYYKDMLKLDWTKSKKFIIWGSVDDFKKRTTISAKIKNYISNIVFSMLLILVMIGKN
ncbi:hypothetical protein [Vibrio brasiliensis]|uniref:CapK related-protein n=1 Tax=Vibrio brasiliensis LMG 20546 TaxID=945543 RepID=E8M051_9VIBR|nr:hypothetical protein [Vibrio brasiliensis]EGA63703.1 CapK related-protein [Vibrio brasiliensis LMG 20546]